MKTATNAHIFTGQILLPAGTGHQPQSPSPARPLGEIYQIPACGTAVARRPKPKTPAVAKAAAKSQSIFAPGKARDIADDPFLERLSRLH